MSAEDKPNVGSIAWTDLTVADADRVRDFYRAVVGWQVESLDMGGYSDYCVKTPGGTVVAGICHARGTNAVMPPQWMVYIIVDDVDAAAAKCVELGGKLVVEPKEMGSQGRFCVIEDPAGAVAALFKPAG